MFADRESHALYQRLKMYNRKAPRLFKRGEKGWSVGDTYFDKSLITLTDEEVYVDVGANQGNTLRDFITAVDGKFKYIFAFEPQSTLCDKLEAEFYPNLSPKIHISSNVVGSQVGFAKVKKRAKYPDGIDQQYEECYEEQSTHICTTLDAAIGTTWNDDRRPTLIKMDVEGMEREVIIGATKILEMFKPRLAIAAYHRRDDIDEIPKLILGINPEYRIYLRHYEREEPHSTIIYAV